MRQTLPYFWFQTFKVAQIKSLSALRQKWWDSFFLHFISKINDSNLIFLHFPDQAWKKVRKNHFPKAEMQWRRGKLKEHVYIENRYRVLWLPHPV